MRAARACDLEARRLSRRVCVDAERLVATDARCSNDCKRELRKQHDRHCRLEGERWATAMAANEAEDKARGVQERREAIEAEREAQQADIERSMERRHMQALSNHRSKQHSVQRCRAVSGEIRTARARSASRLREVDLDKEQAIAADILNRHATGNAMSRERQRERFVLQQAWGDVEFEKDERARQKREAQEMEAAYERGITVMQFQEKRIRAEVPEKRRAIHVKEVQNVRKEMRIQAHVFEELIDKAAYNRNYENVLEQLGNLSAKTAHLRSSVMTRAASAPSIARRPRSAYG